MNCSEPPNFPPFPFLLLSQMQPERRTLKVAQFEQYKGKLGFEGRSQEKLSRAMNAMLDTLEEFGHPAEQINARGSHRIQLDCDHYSVSLRWRSVPLRLGVRATRGFKTTAGLIEVLFTPHFPERCDQEITELLLACALQRMTEELEPLCVFWKGVETPISAKDFLAAFKPQMPQEEEAALASEPHDASTDMLRSEPDLVNPRSDNTAAAPISRPRRATAQSKPFSSAAPLPAARALGHSETLDQPPSWQRLKRAEQAHSQAETEQARGKAFFGSADETLPHLEKTCDRISKTPVSLASSPGPLKPKPIELHSYQKQQQNLRQAMIGQNRIHSLWSAMTNALRGADLVMSLRALVTAVVILFLHGSGMVQAAARAFLP